MGGFELQIIHTLSCEYYEYLIYSWLWEYMCVPQPLNAFVIGGRGAPSPAVGLATGIVRPSVCGKGGTHTLFSVFVPNLDMVWKNHRNAVEGSANTFCFTPVVAYTNAVYRVSAMPKKLLNLV